ncbi:MAG: hypothetical protein QOF51_3263, partial [Chloroflexota bacterium]|nr:hypothetical protein [Chloroflexota bacterium]
VPRYERWIESLGVPIHRTYAVDDLRTIEVGPWEERECNAAVVVLHGQADYMETRVTELPPGATLPPSKFGVDDLIYVLSGTGQTTLWVGEGGEKKSFEWQAHSLFLVPRNYTMQLANLQGHQPARLLHYNYLPMALSIIPEPAFFFDNPATQPTIDLLAGESHDVYSEAKFVTNARRRRAGAWVASFFPDLMAWDRMGHMANRGPGAANAQICLPNVTSLRVGLPTMAVGTYKKAHYHGQGAVIVIPGGEGFSLMWPLEGGEKIMVPWHEGSMFAPPNMWYHQHFNVGGSIARYMTLHPARHIEPEARGSNTDYVDEDPWIRQTFEAELAKRGVKTLMPPEVYTTRSNWQPRDAGEG